MDVDEDSDRNSNDLYSFAGYTSVWVFIRGICVYTISTKVNSALSGHSNIDKSKVLKTVCCLMQVKSIAECSLGAFYNTFDLH